LPENLFKLQDASHLHVQKILRSKSLDTSAFVKCAGGCEIYQDVTVQRPKTPGTTTTIECGCPLQNELELLDLQQGFEEKKTDADVVNQTRTDVF